jgi:hypothetical protein
MIIRWVLRRPVLVAWQLPLLWVMCFDELLKHTDALHLYGLY